MNKTYFIEAGTYCAHVACFGKIFNDGWARSSG